LVLTKPPVWLLNSIAIFSQHFSLSFLVTALDVLFSNTAFLERAIFNRSSLSEKLKLEERFLLIDELIFKKKLLQTK